MEVCLVSLRLFLSRGDLQGDKELKAAKGTQAVKTQLFMIPCSLQYMFFH